MPNNFCSSCGTAFTMPDQAFCSMCGAPSGNSSSVISNFEPFEFHFNRQEFPDFSEGVFTHHHANLVIVGATSERWFPGENSSAVSIADSCARQLPDFASDYTINENFTDGDDFFKNYEAINWADSRIGEKFLRVLSNRGASVAHGYFGRLIQVDLPDGKVEQIPLSEAIDLYSGRWGLSDGTEFSQMGRVYKSNVDGSEIVYWHFDALVNTRYNLFEKDEDITSKVFVPRYLQVAAYLAETPFPSALAGAMGMNARDGLFGPGSSKLPRPAIRHQKDGVAIGLLKNFQGTQALAYWAPEIYQFGYVFTEDMSEDEIYESLPMVCDGIPKIAEIIVDGFANWLPGSELDFQMCLLSDFTLGTDYSIYEAGALVPGVLYGYLCERSNQYYNEAYTSLKNAVRDNNVEAFKASMEGLETLFEFGIGSISAHAANSFAAQALESGLKVDLTNMLEYFSTIDVDSQGVNALSNLIVSHIQGGQYEIANQLLGEALEKCKRHGPNLETLSYFTAWDGSVEEPIFLEIFESALLVKEKLGKKSDLIQVAEQVVEYCNKRSIHPAVLDAARVILD